jgi:hypothetical protein
MKHASLAIWLGLGSAFLALFSTFIALYAAQRKKAAAAAAEQPRGGAAPRGEPRA